MVYGSLQGNPKTDDRGSSSEESRSYAKVKICVCVGLSLPAVIG